MENNENQEYIAQEQSSDTLQNDNPQGNGQQNDCNATQEYCPDNYLIWSILTTIFCCLPLGIVAIVKSSSVDALWFQGRHEEARRAADMAKKCSLCAVLIYVVGAALYVVGAALYVVGGLLMVWIFA